MSKLTLAENQKVLIADLKVASNAFSRMKGLLGTHSLTNEQALWIDRGNSIHTFFMKFPIDCVFLDKQMRVKRIHEDVRPSRLVLPVFGARSVIEMNAGLARKLGLKVGDQVNVVD